jgi:hypothetical protein
MTAREGALRLVTVATRLDPLGVYVGSMQWSSYGPISTATDAIGFLRIEREFGLTRSADDGDVRGNVYATGEIGGVTVKIYTGKARFEMVQVHVPTTRDEVDAYLDQHAAVSS